MDEVGKKSRIGNPFDAVPIKATAVEAREDDQSCICLRRTVETRFSRIPLLGRIFPKQENFWFQLDGLGSEFWKLIDGERNLGDIELRLRKKLKLEEDLSRQSVMQYTKALMLRGLIMLKVTQE